MQDKTNLITEARELIEALHAGEYDDEYIGTGAYLMLDELCDALEKGEAEVDRLSQLAMMREGEVGDRDREIERLREAMRWIPVTGQLPTERGYYLAVIKRIAPDELGGNNTRVKIMRWMGEDWRYAFHFPKWINDEITETVTHWMPLPAPPEEGE